MVNIRGGLAIWCPFSEGADQLLRRTSSGASRARGLPGTYKEQRSDRRPAGCLVMAQASQSRFVEKQRRSLRHAFILRSSAR
jgi:hypothetical protein